MGSTIIGNPRTSAPTSDGNADFGAAFARTVDTVAELQTAITRGLQPKYQLEITGTGDLLIRDTLAKRTATIPLNWEDY